MSFNRLNYDMCQYKQTIHESISPGNYMLGTPPIDCDPCYPKPPTVRLQKSGDSIDRSVALVDTESDLKNVNKTATKCSVLSKDKNNSVKKVIAASNKVEYENINNIKPTDNLTHWKDCFEHSVDTRFVDPPSNLRGTGFDRWEYLCFNPQEKVLIPFDNNIQNRILVKDNHRPCVPKPIDPKNVFPNDPKEILCEKTIPVCSAPTTNSLNCKLNDFYKS